MKWVALLAAAGLLHAQDAREIVRRSVSRDLRTRELRRNYTYTSTAVEKQLDSRGAAKKAESETYEHSILYGEPYERLVKRNDKPLPDKDERKEQDKLAKLTAKREKETPAQREKRLAEFDAKRAKEASWVREISDAYNFTQLADDNIDGRDVYVIAAEPRPEYHAKASEAKYMKKIRAKLWIDKSDHHWVKVEAEAIDTISVGLVLLRLYKGSRLQFEQTRVNDEIWLPRHAHIVASGRLGLVFKGGFELDTVFENYRKFQSDSRIIATQ
jgi:hypothetical protein